MSTGYWSVGFPTVARAEAKGTIVRAEAALRAAGWIDGEDDPTAAYCADVPIYRPGPTAGIETKAYDLADGNVNKTLNGVAFHAERYINHAPFSDTPHFRCPICGVQMREVDADGRAETMQERCFARFQTFFESEDQSRDVACVSCEAASDISDFIDDTPTFVLSEVAIEFWEWPEQKVLAAAAVLDLALGQRQVLGSNVV